MEEVKKPKSKGNKKIWFIIVMILLAIVAIGGTLFYINKDKTKKETKKNERPRLEDDFYTYINYDDLQKITISKDKPGWSVLRDITNKIEEEEDKIVEEMLKDSSNKNMQNLYSNLLNEEARNKLGYEPLKKYFDLIDKATTMEELLNVVYIINDETYINPLFESLLFKDVKDKNKVALQIVTTIQGDCEFYNDSNYAMLFNQLKNIYKEELKIVGLKEEEINYLESFFEIEKNACEGALTQAEQNDLEKSYNVYTYNQVKQIFSNVNVDRLLARYNVSKIDNFIISDEKTSKKFNEMLSDKNLNEFKTIIKLSLVSSFGNLLTTELDNHLKKSSDTLNGTDSSSLSKEKIARNAVRDAYSDLIEKEYSLRNIDNHKEAIETTKKVINDVKEEYYNNIKNATWLSDETKAKALKKLDTLKVRVGIPEEFNIISNNYTIKTYEEGSNLIENFIEIQKVSFNESLRKVFGADNDKIWEIRVDQANAFYQATDNSINFPLGIILSVQNDSSYYQILGNLGMVAAHEMSHAFDNTGGIFDEYGNYNNWWNPQDYDKFKSLQKKIIDYYSNFTYEGKKLNGELTVGENFADLASVETITNIALRRNATEQEYKDMYESYAKFWLSKYNSQYMSQLLLIDTHSPDIVRVNAVLANQDKFYEIYGIKEEDSLFISKENRIHIWN